MQTHLSSPLNLQLASLLRQDPELAAARFDIRHETVPQFLHQYPYTVGAWPIFVARDIVQNQFEPLIQVMPRLFREALQAGFTDSAAMTDYFGWPELTYHVLQDAPFADADLLIRYDAVLGPAGLQLLESNCGSSAGGWQDDYFQLQMQPRLARFARHQAAQIEYRSILECLLRTLLRGILRRKPATATGHVLVHHTFAPAGLDPPNFQESLQRLYDAVKPPQLAQGRIHIFRNLDEMSFTAAGELVMCGTQVDALILGDVLLTDIPQQTLNRLIGAQLREHLVFPDSPFHALLSDKGLLALLHECADAQLLATDDCALIRRFVPWTARVRDVELELDGTRSALIPHLLRHKDDFVLKKFHSNSGRHVAVGRFCSDAQWHTAVQHARHETRWIVQRFCSPSLLDVHDPQHGVVPHAVIWGLFGYGGEYAGAFVRADCGVTHGGVINSATGAREFPVFEVD